jgi:hypothetical protein
MHGMHWIFWQVMTLLNRIPRQSSFEAEETQHYKERRKLLSRISRQATRLNTLVDLYPDNRDEIYDDYMFTTEHVLVPVALLFQTPLFDDDSETCDIYELFFLDQAGQLLFAMQPDSSRTVRPVLLESHGTSNRQLQQALVVIKQLIDEFEWVYTPTHYV